MGQSHSYTLVHKFTDLTDDYVVDQWLDTKFTELEAKHPDCLISNWEVKGMDVDYLGNTVVLVEITLREIPKP